MKTEYHKKQYSKQESEIINAAYFFLVLMAQFCKKELSATKKEAFNPKKRIGYQYPVRVYLCNTLHSSFNGSLSLKLKAALLGCDHSTVLSQVSKHNDLISKNKIYARLVNSIERYKSDAYETVIELGRKVNILSISYNEVECGLSAYEWSVLLIAYRHVTEVYGIRISKLKVQLWERESSNARNLLLALLFDKCPLFGLERAAKLLGRKDHASIFNSLSVHVGYMNVRNMTPYKLNVLHGLQKLSKISSVSVYNNIRKEPKLVAEARTLHQKLLNFVQS